MEWFNSHYSCTPCALVETCYCNGYMHVKIKGVYWLLAACVYCLSAIQGGVGYLPQMALECTMQSKKKYNAVSSYHQIMINPSTRSTVDFNSIEVKTQLEEVKRKIKEVMDNSQVDVEKLSVPFSI